MSAADFRRERDRRGPFYDRMNRYSQALQALIGVRRSTVSLILGTLDKAGVIRNGMKKITIVRPEGLRKHVVRVLRNTEFCARHGTVVTRRAQARVTKA